MIVWMCSADFFSADTSGELFGGWAPVVTINPGDAPLVRAISPPVYNLQFYKVIPTAGTSVWVHQHVYFDSGALVTDLQFGEYGVSWNLMFRRTTEGYLQVLRGTGPTVLGTGTIPIQLEHYYDLAWEISFHNSTGTIRVWIDGVLDLNLTGLDTIEAGTGALTIVGWANEGKFDNIVIAARTAPFADAIPNVRVDCIRPNANGDDRAWTPSTGTDDFAVVDDEQSVAAEPDYLASSTVGDRVCVHLEPFTNAGGTILAVQASCRMKKMDGGAAGLKLYLKTAGGGRYYSDEFFPKIGRAHV